LRQEIAKPAFLDFDKIDAVAGSQPELLADLWGKGDTAVER